MAVTAKGVPYPGLDDSNDAPADITALAEWLDDHPGVRAMTTTMRDSLSGDDRWPGRAIVNVSTGRIEWWTGDRWETAALAGHSHTPGEIGAAPASHPHAASAINSGTFPVARGGTGRASLTAGSYLRGNGTDIVTLATPTNVRADIGAAAATDLASHVNAANPHSGSLSTSHVDSTVLRPGHVGRGVLGDYSFATDTAGWPTGITLANIDGGGSGSPPGSSNQDSFVVETRVVSATRVFQTATKVQQAGGLDAGRMLVRGNASTVNNTWSPWREAT